MSNPKSHHPSRRRTIGLGLAGGGVVLASTGLSGCSAAHPDSSVSPWHTRPPRAVVRRFMWAHGLLAPNPHNQQPWLADLRREGEITLVCDEKRLLPQTDPHGRQILIRCGAFIELAVMPRQNWVCACRLTLFPQARHRRWRCPAAGSWRV